ncbi:MAG: hypothetical protein OXE55_02955 [Flavobacteriaceae bacterium]|nr:hypothetical protein [Flavobacteriaceae bacterium]MCY4254475.1 hypothetical protein [Flavobacteriaceae bacterium]
MTKVLRRFDIGKALASRGSLTERTSEIWTGNSLKQKSQLLELGNHNILNSKT